MTDFTLRKGATFEATVRWERPVTAYRAISAIQKTAPARLTVTDHGVPNGWMVAITGAKGMKQINAANFPPKDKDYVKATAVDANTLELNDIDATGFGTYTANTATLRYYVPADLVGFTARLQARLKVDDTATVLELTTENGGIALDNASKTITLNLSAAATAALTWKKAVYDLELAGPSAVVVPLLSGTITVEKEITR